VSHQPKIIVNAQRVPITTSNSPDEPGVYSIDPSNPFILVNTEGGGAVAKLPPASMCPGQQICVKRTGGPDENVVTIIGDTFELIDGETNFRLAHAFAFVTFLSTGEGWFVIG